MELEDKVAIVTASGHGIGRGIALGLAREGADIVINSLHEGNTNKVANEVRALEAEWDYVYQKNLKASVLMSKAIEPYFMKQKSGKVVNVSSVAVRFAGRIAGASYGSLKAALIRFSQSLAEEFGPYNVNVNCICPGMVYNELWESRGKQAIESNPELKGLTPYEYLLRLAEGKHQDVVAATPLRRGQTPEDMGNAVVFLVSEAGKNISGQALNINSGRIKS